MKHITLGLGALALFTAAVAFSRQEQSGALAVKQEKRNPWTAARPNIDPGEFQFAIISDRTGGHRAKVFSRAVARLNLLQPEFIVSVGDLIEGGKKADKTLEAEWREFDSYVKRLQMPFFYVPGNHDAGNEATEKMWEKRLGRRHFHFVYRNVLFLCLNTEDPPGSGNPGRLGKEQIAYAKKALADNAGVRWTMVMLHKPIWTADDLEKCGWGPVEKALADRPYTVFCGHIHRYRKFVRQGRNYYQLATTGGGSKVRGVRYGEFDHIVWVTMKKDGPLLANILLDSVLPDDLKVPESSEEGVKVKKRKTHPVRGALYLDGAPVAWAQIVFTVADAKGRAARGGDAMTEGDGSFVPSTYTAGDGLATGMYRVAVELRRPLFLPDGKPGPNLLPAKYARPGTSGLRVEVKEGDNEVKVELSSNE